jgi:hypothetical protein
VDDDVDGLVDRLRALPVDDGSPLVRLSAVRATAILLCASAFALLDGRDDPENPGLAQWRDHYRSASG